MAFVDPRKHIFRLATIRFDIFYGNVGTSKQVQDEADQRVSRFTCGSRGMCAGFRKTATNKHSSLPTMWTSWKCTIASLPMRCAHIVCVDIQCQANGQLEKTDPH